MVFANNRRVIFVISGLIAITLLSTFILNSSNSSDKNSDKKIKVDSASLVYSEPTQTGMPIDQCKIKEVSEERIKFGDLAAGFPFVKRFGSYPKEIKMAIVPIDFQDLQGDANLNQRVQDQTKYLSEWYSTVSQGKFNVNWEINTNWIRLPGNSSDYSVPYSGAYPETTNFWKRVIPVVDKKVDLTGVQTINFVLPSGQNFIEESVQGFSYGRSEMQVANSTRTKLISFTTAGKYFDVPGKAYWSYWAHEFGHQLGIAHVGSSRGESQPMNGLDLLGNQDGPYRELSGWLRFIIGWLDDSQVYCQDTKSLLENKVSLIPLSDTSTGIKLVVIPTSKSSAIMIESRRPTKFSCSGINLPSGVLIYKYDAKMGNQSYFIAAQFPEDRQRYIKCPGNFNMEDYPDTLIHKGEKMIVDNFEISVLDSSNIDKVSIKKLS